MKGLLIVSMLLMALPSWSQTRGPRNPRNSYPMEQTIIRQTQDLRRAAQNLSIYVDRFGREDSHWDDERDVARKMNAVFETARLVQSVQVFHDLVANDRIVWTYYQLPAAYNKLAVDMEVAIEAVEDIERTLRWKEWTQVLNEMRKVETEMHHLGRAVERIDRRVDPTPNPVPPRNPPPRNPPPRGALFVVSLCESINQQPRYCSKADLGVPASANIVRVEKLQTISNAACIEFKDWKWDVNGITVLDGCRAQFRVHYELRPR